MIRSLFFPLLFILLSAKNLSAQSPKQLDSLLALEKTLPDGSEKIRTLTFIGFNYSRNSSEKAKYYYKKAIALGEKMGENPQTSSAYSQIANFYNKLGEIDSVEYFLQKARIKAEKANDDKSWSAYYQNRTLISKKQKKIEEAIKFGKESLKYNIADGKKKNIAGAYMNLGNCYMEMRNFEPAADYFYKALKIFEEINNENGKAFCYNNLGNVYKELKQHEESIKYAKLSLGLKQKANDEAGMAMSYMLISINYLMLKNYKPALEYLNKSIALQKKLGDKYILADNYQLQGRIFRGMKDTVQAVKSYDQAIAIVNQLQNTKMLNELQTEKLTLIPANKIPETTTQSIETNLSLSKETNDINTRLNNLEYLSDFHYKKGNYKKAFDYQSEYYQLKNQLYGPDVLKKIKTLESQYELEKKETAIKLLQKDKELKENQLQKQRIGIYAAIGTVLFVLIIAYLLFNRNKIIQEKKRLQEMETMRHNIAGDLHDDIGSTLSSIQIISSMAASHCGENKNLQHSINQIHELSDKVASGIREIVWSVNPAYDKLNAIIPQLHKLAADVLGANEIAFKFKEDIADLNKEMTPQQRKDLMMIFKEALNNTRKYSGTNRVDIQIKQIPQSLTLHIKDYGCGFDMETVNRGNGISSMERRAKEINAEFAVHSKPGKGTFLSLKIPLS